LATLVGMGPSPGSFKGAPVTPRAGTVDYRLARRFLISEYRKGRLARHQVCDAHPELVRAAGQVGVATETVCPICETEPLVHVTYVFGPRLPAFGRCITEQGELAKLNKRAEPLTAYVVEVCRGCSWHHLTRTFGLGANGRRAATS
jgi:hypothetical protein